MNNKTAVYIGGALALILLGVSVFFLVRNKTNNFSFSKAKAEVDIKCETSHEEGQLKVNDSFSCTVLGKNYTFTVKNIKDDKMTIKADKTGLTKVKEDGTINLNDPMDTFEITKGDTIKISAQATDVSSNMEVTWKK